MMRIRACFVRRTAVVRTILLAALCLGVRAMPAAAATVSGTMTVVGHLNPTGQIVYTIVLFNAGPTAQPDNPQNEFFDILPPNVTFNEVSATSGTVLLLPGNAITWNGSLPGNGSVTIRIDAQVGPLNRPGTVISNQGTMLFDADDNGSNESSALTDDPTVAGAADPTSFTVIPTVTVTGTKTVTGTFSPGGLVTYTVVVFNAGPGFQNDQEGAEFFDLLPAGLTVVDVTATRGFPNSAVGALGPVAYWDGELGEAESVTITITARIDAAIPAGTVISNQGTVVFDADASGGNESVAPTDDPTVDGAANPTSFIVGASAPSGGRAPWIDLNGDGLGDVVLYAPATGGGSSQVNDHSGGFTAFPASWDAGWQIFPLNLNTDASTDLFFYNPVTGLWVQGLSLGSGGYSYTVGNWDPGWQVHPADFDGDAITDLFLYEPATGVWAKSFVDGSGGFANYTFGNWRTGLGFTRADFNGDGRDDLFLYDVDNGAWAKAVSQAGFGAFDFLAGGQWGPGWVIQAADLNGDGRTDLVLSEAAGFHISALSRPDGAFDYPVEGQWEVGWAIATGDLDGDGRTDLFLYNAATGAWKVAYSDGTGDFTYQQDHWGAGWTVGVTDADGDGRADILLSEAGGVWVQATSVGPGIFTYSGGTWTPGSTVLTQKP
ncbi:MAG: FG-GAP-like repeat-containing protein [Acidobacteriota bacterium]